MKKLNVLFILCLFGVASCDFSPKEEELPEMQDALLWEISGNELTEPSYLFGTFNGISSSFLDSVAGFATAFKSVKQVMVEVDLLNISKVDQTSVDERLLSDSSYFNSLMPQDTTYQMLYSPEDYAFVDSALKSQGINYSLLRPIAVAHKYMTSVKLLQVPLEGNNSLDLAIMNDAKKASLKLIGLETMNENQQYKSSNPDYEQMYGGSLKDQAFGLLFLLKARPIYMNVPIRMDSMYRQQNPGELYIPINEGVDDIREALAKCPDFKMKEAYKDSAIKQLNSYLGTMLDKRTEKWMKKILYSMKKQPTLISVGALHLIGENGLINQLRQYGYTVQPILSDGK